MFKTNSKNSKNPKSSNSFNFFKLLYDNKFWTIKQRTLVIGVSSIIMVGVVGAVLGMTLSSVFTDQFTYKSDKNIEIWTTFAPNDQQAVGFTKNMQDPFNKFLETYDGNNDGIYDYPDYHVTMVPTDNFLINSDIGIKLKAGSTVPNITIGDTSSSLALINESKNSWLWDMNDIFSNNSQGKGAINGVSTIDDSSQPTSNKTITPYLPFMSVTYADFIDGNIMWNFLNDVQNDSLSPITFSSDLIETFDPSSVSTQDFIGYSTKDLQGSWDNVPKWTIDYLNSNYGLDWNWESSDPNTYLQDSLPGTVGSSVFATQEGLWAMSLIITQYYKDELGYGNGISGYAPDYYQNMQYQYTFASLIDNQLDPNKNWFWNDTSDYDFINNVDLQNAYNKTFEVQDKYNIDKNMWLGGLNKGVYATSAMNANELLFSDALASANKYTGYDGYDVDSNGNWTMNAKTKATFDSIYDPISNPSFETTSKARTNQIQVLPPPVFWDADGITSTSASYMDGYARIGSRTLLGIKNSPDGTSMEDEVTKLFFKWFVDNSTGDNVTNEMYQYYFDLGYLPPITSATSLNGYSLWLDNKIENNPDPRTEFLARTSKMEIKLIEDTYPGNDLGFQQYLEVPSEAKPTYDSALDQDLKSWILTNGSIPSDPVESLINRLKVVT